MHKANSGTGKGPIMTATACCAAHAHESRHFMNHWVLINFLSPLVNFKTWTPVFFCNHQRHSYRRFPPFCGVIVAWSHFLSRRRRPQTLAFYSVCSASSVVVLFIQCLALVWRSSSTDVMRSLDVYGLRYKTNFKHTRDRNIIMFCTVLNEVSSCPCSLSLIHNEGVMMFLSSTRVLFSLLRRNFIPRSGGWSLYINL